MAEGGTADPLGLRDFVTSTLKSILTDQEQPDMLVNYVLMLISNEKTLPEIEKELEELLGAEDSSRFCLHLGAEMESKKQGTEEYSSSSKTAGTGTAGQKRLLDAALSSVTTTGKRDRDSGGKREPREVQGDSGSGGGRGGDGASFKRPRGPPGDMGSGGGGGRGQRAPFPPRAPRPPPPTPTPPSSANTILQQMNTMAQAAGFSSADEMMMAQQAAMQQMLMGGGGAMPFVGGRGRGGGGRGRGGAETYGGRGGRGGYNAGADAYGGGGRGRGRGWHDSHASAGRGRGRAPSGGGRDPFGGRGRGKPVFEDENMSYVRVDLDGSLPSGR